MFQLQSRQPTGLSDPQPNCGSGAHVLIQAHSASMRIAFYNASQFPVEYQADGFAAEHGSWNRAKRTGYKVIRVRLKDGETPRRRSNSVNG